ncbi:hypothetical protein CFP56_018790 [Quercus suber]|uniref:Uncharacterized protein n=1 Tax=Quercus suber TaxID=58331 RepID=A0AAW0KM40_QUESU
MELVKIPNLGDQALFQDGSKFSAISNITSWEAVGISPSNNCIYIMLLLGDCDINLKGLRSKKKKMVDNSDWRPWSELPEALLYLITKMQRLYVVAYKQEFMASQPPLVIFMSNRSRRACYFHNIFDRRMLGVQRNTPQPCWQIVF